MKALRIRNTDVDWQLRFFAHVQQIFRPDNWRAWRDRGGWTTDYEVFALLDGDQIVSTVGRSRMQLVDNGRAVAGYQLGAVGTLPHYRGRGLARRLMDEVVGELDYPDQPIICMPTTALWTSIRASASGALPKNSLSPAFRLRRQQCRLNASIPTTPRSLRYGRLVGHGATFPAGRLRRAVIRSRCVRIDRRARPTAEPGAHLTE